MLIACILEFVIGNTFTGVSFGTYGGFWIAQAITLTPYFHAASSYEPKNPANPGFHASFGMSHRLFWELSANITSIRISIHGRTNIRIPDLLFAHQRRLRLPFRDYHDGILPARRRLLAPCRAGCSEG